jgi:hypothetical protein
MKNGIRLVVHHPDFFFEPEAEGEVDGSEPSEDGDSEAREARLRFLSGFELGWPDIRDSQDLDLVPEVGDGEAAVMIYFPYGLNGVRAAEEAVSATIATISLYVADRNHRHEEEILPAYGFAILRDAPPLDWEDS